MEEALCSILCRQEHWFNDSCLWQMVKFHEDGSGELCCVGDIGLAWGVMFRWTKLPRTEEDRSNDDQAVKHINTLTEAPRFLGTLRLDITLENKTARWLEDNRMGGAAELWNPRFFLPSAFFTRTFEMIIEKADRGVERFVRLESESE